jgi:hypothetical protein
VPATCLPDIADAGLSRARSQGKRLGRRPLSRDVVESIWAQLATGSGILRTAKALGVGTGTVHRVKREIEALAARPAAIPAVNPRKRFDAPLHRPYCREARPGPRSCARAAFRHWDSGTWFHRRNPPGMWLIVVNV